MSSLGLSVKLDVKGVTKKLNNLQKKQVPFAVAKALTQTAKDGQKETVRQMQRKFDRPTKYTLNSIFIIPSFKRGGTEASVNIKEFGGKGNAAFDYLQPSMEGGQRPLKRYEKLLKMRGILPSGYYTVPGAGADLDAHGNMRASQISKMLSDVHAQLDRHQRTKARRKRYYYLDLGHVQGIFFGQGRRIRPFMIFVPRARYHVRFEFAKIVNGIAKNKFKRNFNNALAFALKTARW